MTSRRLLVVSVITVAAYQLLPAGLWWEAAGQFGAGLAAAVVVTVGAWRQPRGQRWTWMCFAVGILLHACGHLAWAASMTITGTGGLDPWWLLLYPFVAAGAFGVIRSRRGRREVSALFDSVTAATGTAVLCWVAVIGPAANDTTLEPGHRLVLIAYPIADVLIIALVTRLLGQHDRNPSVTWITASLSFILASDLFWVVAGLAGIDLTGNQVVYRGVQQLFLIAYACMAMAAWVAGSADRAEEAEEAGRGAWRGLLLTTASTLVGPAVLWADAADGWVAYGRVIAGGCAVLFLLAAARIALTLRQLTEAADRLRDMARHDALTGLPNRRAWNEQFPRVLQDSLRTGTIVSVALLDLDRFKKYNDSRGHQAGDDLLAETAKQWRGCLRVGDMLARYGGEEFVVLLIDADADEAGAILGRLRATTPYGQTFSAGVATWNREEEPHGLLNRADRALYRAKAEGRDRTVVAAAVSA